VRKANRRREGGARRVCREVRVEISERELQRGVSREGFPERDFQSGISREWLPESGFQRVVSREGFPKEGVLVGDSRVRRWVGRVR